jgi:glycosyltransferase involved in cell wall biosynthesis
MTAPDAYAKIGRIAYLTAGAGGMFCGSCMHDNTLVKALISRGVDAVLIPTYTPIRTDESNVSQKRVFFGGINVYLRQKMPWLRWAPRPITGWLDNARLLRWVASRAMKTSAAALGDLTVSMLRGADGPQRGEVKKLVDWLEGDVKPSVVVLTNMLIAGCVPEIKRRLNVPVLVTLQGDDIFLRDLPETHLRQCRRLLTEIDRHVDGYITNSHFYADFMSRDLNLSREKFHIAPLAIDSEDLATIRQSPPQSPSNRLTIGYLARLAPEKGLHVLADAFALLVQHAALADHDVRLRVAGWLGPQNKDYAEAVFHKLREVGLSDQVEYVGQVDRGEKAEFLRSLDVLSVPTVYKEPKGLFVLEALAAGVPVVQPNHGAFPEMLEATGGGVLFAPDDHADLAEKLAELLLDKDHRARLAEQGRHAVHTQFSVGPMADRAVEIYQQSRERMEHGRDTE